LGDVTLNALTVDQPQAEIDDQPYDRQPGDNPIDAGVQPRARRQGRAVAAQLRAASVGINQHGRTTFRAWSPIFIAAVGHHSCSRRDDPFAEQPLFYLLCEKNVKRDILVFNHGSNPVCGYNDNTGLADKLTASLVNGFTPALPLVTDNL
jgi:hypothetical protein